MTKQSHLLSIRQYSVNVLLHCSTSEYKMKNSQTASMQMKMIQELNRSPTTDVWAKKTDEGSCSSRDTQGF